MKAEINASAKNVKSYQGTASANSASKVVSAGISKEQELLKEFAGIMDKIAAQLNDNLGCDYNTLLESMNALQISQSAASVVAPHKTESKQEHPESEAISKDSDEGQIGQEENLSGHSDNEVKESEKESHSADSAQAKTSSKNEPATKADETVTVSKEAPSKENCSPSKVEQQVQKEAGVSEGNTNIEESAVVTEHLETAEAAPKSNKIQPDPKATVRNTQSSNELESHKPVDSHTTEQELEVASPADKNIGSQLDTATTLNTKQPESSNRDAALANEIMKAMLAPVGATVSLQSQPMEPGKTASLVREAMRSVLEAIGEKGSSSLGQNSSLYSSSSGAFSLKNASAEQAAARAKPIATQSQMLKNFERVENALKEAAKSKDGKTISLRLDPPDLGSVKVDVSLKDGTLHARISGENSTVNTMLREKAHELQAALRKLGLDVDRITVAAGGEQQELSADTGFSNYQTKDSGHDDRARESEVETEQAAFASSANSAAEQVVNDHWIA